ncbi:partial Proline dehydrogenase 2, partial [Methylophilaceae bacterium]
LGLDISEELAFKNAEIIIKKAATNGNFVRLDMEGSAYTQKTIDAFLKLRRKYPNAGIAIQSSLLKSREDARLIASKGGSVRLVKGAYKEPPSIAFKEKKDVDSNYEAIMKELLLSGTRPAIATHDVRLINEAKRFAAEKGLAKNTFDFEMLLGIKRELQKKLASEGYRVRVYIPYGKNWLPYTVRRLRERKENVWFVLKNIFER